MQTIEYTTIDKTKWGPGEWQQECDKRQWLDDATGLPCMIRRSPSFGGWCGYAGVPRGHQLHGVGYDDGALDLDVHGGVTFAGECRPGDAATAICHVSDEGEPDDVWWFGFDCGHAFDFSPAYNARQQDNGWSSELDEVYRNQAYVTAETLKLAQQLARK